MAYRWEQVKKQETRTQQRWKNKKGKYYMTWAKDHQNQNKGQSHSSIYLSICLSICHSKQKAFVTSASWSHLLRIFSIKENNFSNKDVASKMM